MTERIIDELTFLLKEEISPICGNEYVVEEHCAAKNNGAKEKGIIVKFRGDNVAPVFYTKNYVDDYMNGTPLSDIAKGILDTFEDAMAHSPVDTESVNQFMTLDFVTDHLAFDLISFEKNKDRLNDIPYVSCMNLAITFRVIVNQSESHASYVVTKDIADKLGLSLADLMSFAVLNTPRLLPARVSSLDDVMFAVMMGSGQPDMFDKAANLLESDNPRDWESKMSSLYVVSNKSGIRGASVILYNGVLKKIADMLDSDLVILPSSIHEILVHPYDERIEISQLASMVQEINDTQVEPGEVLENTPYIYRRSDDKLCLA